MSRRFTDAIGTSCSFSYVLLTNQIKHSQNVHLQSYDAKEFDKLVSKYEKLNWRIISKPGGATVKPDDFYMLYGYQMQASQGDNASERPMWAEKGGLDFEGRARWDAWTAVKGMATEKAKHEFVKTYYEFPVKALYSDTRGTA